MNLLVFGAGAGFVLGALLVYIGANVHRFSHWGREALLVAGVTMLAGTSGRTAYLLELITNEQQRVINAYISIFAASILIQLVLLYRIERKGNGQG